MKTDLFQSCGHCWVFQICWHIECSTFTASSFRIWNSSKIILVFLKTTWRSRRTCTHLLRELQNYTSLLNSHRQEKVGSHQKKIPHVQGQSRSPSKMVGGVKSNPIPTRDARRVQTKPCAYQDLETPQRLSQSCLLSVCMSSVVVRVSSGLLQGQGLWGQQTWIIQRVAKALLEEVAINPATEPLSRRPTNCRTIILNNAKQ